MHDDVNIRPRMVNYEIVSTATQFDKIADIDHDISYVFKSVMEEQENAAVHGRGIYMKPKFIQWLLDTNDGIWWDENNDGHIMGPTPEHCEHFNHADYVLRDYFRTAQRNGADWKSGTTIIPAFDHANRGRYDRLWNPIGQKL